MKLVVLLAIAASPLMPAALPEFSRIEPEKGFTLANTHVRLEFSPGAMGLAAMTDVASGRNHLAGPKAKPLLWEIAMGRGTQTRTLDNSYKPCNYARLERWPGGAQRAVFEWNDLRWHLEDKVLTVRVTIDLPSDSGVAEWRIFVENHSDYWGLSSVTFPIAAGLPESGEYDVARPVFASGGHLLKAFRDKIRARHPLGRLAHAGYLSQSRARRGLPRHHGPGRASQGLRHRTRLAARAASLSGEHGRAGLGLARSLRRRFRRLPGRVGRGGSPLPRLGAQTEMGAGRPPSRAAPKCRTSSRMPPSGCRTAGSGTRPPAPRSK